MNVLICPDKFKLTFSAVEIAKEIKLIAETFGHSTQIVPLSDGGDGFLQVIENNILSKRIYHYASDPLLRKIKTFFLLDEKTNNVYIELAKTGSLSLIPPKLRNPMNTNTIGLGEQLNEALKLNPEKIFIGLGGSSTTDAGIGMAYALGYKFRNWKGHLLFPIGRNLINIQYIEKIPLNLPQIFACVDVDNPLYGSNGAAYVYSPQKGASPEQVEYLDRGLRNFAYIIENQLNTHLNSTPGEGAAGGLGAGIKAFLRGKIISGAEMIINLTQLQEKIKKADLVITGEGKFDTQSLQGKITGQVINLAHKYNKPVLVISGISELVSQNNLHIIKLFDHPVSTKTAKKNSISILKEKLRQYFKNLSV